ncbi:MAG: UDP-N-acetylmuramoyl-tripeptide--D-alanyl-D-alanine ligase [Syntrophomonadaceae bacterium]
MKTLILKRPVIAVAGSSGKTTTKEMIASILKRRWRIYKSAKNRTNRDHIRIHRRRIKPSHRAVVLEYSMSYRGHLRRSCQIIQPNMAIVTMVGTAHIGNLGGSLEALIKAKSGIIQHMKPTGTLLLNADDANSQRLDFGRFRGRVIKVGIKKPADYQASRIDYGQRGMNFSVSLAGQTYRFFIPVFGEHNVYNALFAIAAADQLGFRPAQIDKGLRSFRRPPHRLRVYRLKRGVRLLDDTFNANPHSVKAALDVLSRVGKEHRVAVLGNMSELGRYSERGHREVGEYLAGHEISQLLTYGKKARQIGTAAVAAGLPVRNVQHSPTRARLHRSLRGAIKHGTTILVKGSHDQHMVRTVRFLRRAGGIAPQ